MIKLNQECKCKEVLEILEQTRSSIKEKYSNYRIVDADFVRTQKAMFFEKIDSLYKPIKVKKEV